VSEQRYFGSFSSRDDVLKAFCDPLVDLPSDEQILFASYGEQAYEGDALVVFLDGNGQLLSVEASHCSCYGLEGQWDPKPTTLAALGMMWRNAVYGHGDDAVAAFRKTFPTPEEAAG